MGECGDCSSEISWVGIEISQSDWSMVSQSHGWLLKSANLIGQSESREQITIKIVNNGTNVHKL